jgi:hypothetical protein
LVEMAATFGGADLTAVAAGAAAEAAPTLNFFPHAHLATCPAADSGNLYCFPQPGQAIVGIVGPPTSRTTSLRTQSSWPLIDPCLCACSRPNSAIRRFYLSHERIATVVSRQNTATTHYTEMSAVLPTARRELLPMSPDLAYTAIGPRRILDSLAHASEQAHSRGVEIRGGTWVANRDVHRPRLLPNLWRLWSPGLREICLVYAAEPRAARQRYFVTKSILARD